MDESASVVAKRDRPGCCRGGFILALDRDAVDDCVGVREVVGISSHADVDFLSARAALHRVVPVLLRVDREQVARPEVSCKDAFCFDPHGILQIPYTHRVPARDGSWVSWMTPSMTAV